MIIYFDNAATTPIYPEVLELMTQLNQELWGNPSSLHSIGRKARKALEKARQGLAELLNASSEEIFFTSGATESNNTIIKLFDFDLIVTSPSEHASVIESVKACNKPVHWLELDREGFINLDSLKKIFEINQDKKILLSLMHGNNEIGTINDLNAISQLVRSYENVFFHSDCVQTFTKHDIDLSKLDIDFISASAHKIHGPKGIGVLYINKSIQEKCALLISPLLLGGGQEKDIRPGTQNVIGAIAFAKAAQINSSKERKNKTYDLQKYLLEELSKIEGFVLNGCLDLRTRVLGNLNFAFTNCRLQSEELVLQLDLKGFAVSSGSACTSNKASKEASIESSYVLRACRIPEDIAKKSVRVSISSMNSREEVDRFVSTIYSLVDNFHISKALQAPQAVQAKP